MSTVAAISFGLVIGIAIALAAGAIIVFRFFLGMWGKK